jgi:TonB family protein
MSKALLTILILLLTVFCFAQTKTTTYFKRPDLRVEVSERQARFSRTVIINTDSTVTTEVKDLRKNETLRSETYKGDEPYGIWRYGLTRIDYNFDVSYSDEECDDSLSGIKNSLRLEDSHSLDYKAPRLSTGQTITQLLIHDVVYPFPARIRGRGGEIYITFTVPESGKLENIHIRNGTNILLAKEVIRVLRNVIIVRPATLNGQPQSFCMTMPLTFRME